MAHRIHVTAHGVEVCVVPGKKSAHDFIVKYVEPGKRARTPQHVPLIVRLHVKQAHDVRTTLALRDHLPTVYDRIAPAAAFPPMLQVFHLGNAGAFTNLGTVGEFSVEFLLVVSELIFIEEKTN